MSRPAGDLTGRTVLVTGAGRGLGRAYALDAAAHGANVVVNDVDAHAADETVAALTAAGGSGLAVGGDVARWDAARGLVATAAAWRGELHGVVCNAGVFWVEDPWAVDGADARRMIDVNVMGTLAVGVAAMEVLTAGASIVTVTSGAAGGMSGMAVYGATKGAVLALSASWAIDLAPRGIRVNAVSPLAETRLTDIGRRRLGPTPPQPPPERVAPLVTFLLGPAADGITGRVFRVDADAVWLMAALSPVAHVPCPGVPTADEMASAVGALVAR